MNAPPGVINDLQDEKYIRYLNVSRQFYLKILFPIALDLNHAEFFQLSFGPLFFVKELNLIIYFRQFGPHGLTNF